ncbi:GNAT family N-acetyltransferase [Margalitia sp. FSL K6-0131]|uniref:GNAT family N-acetyltransferase n=1 Tax=Margalitia sp. FSL K6-0131 TaxID=2954604 RepID=UPI0030F78474
MDTILPGGLTIKLASDSDSKQIIYLLKETAQWIKSKNIDQWQYLLEGGDDEEISLAISNQFTYKVLEGTELIGTFTLSPTQSEWDIHIFGPEEVQNSLYLHRLAVAPRKMGKGIGMAIIQWIKDNIQTDKKYLKLDCVSHNTKLNHFYQKNGFDYIGETDSHSKYQKRIRG